MNLILFYDTETTGFPQWQKPSDSPDQPHIVQIAAHLVDSDTRDVLQSVDLVVRPEGWEIPEEVSAIHGITHEYASDVGIKEADVINVFLGLWAGVTRIAHNESFDARIVRIAVKRHIDDAMSEKWSSGKSECTMSLATPIVKCPPTEKMLAKNMKGHKKCNMGEAYKHFTGSDLLKAHSAIADVNACMAVYFAIQDQKNAETTI